MSTSAWRLRATGSTARYNERPFAVIDTITGAASASAEREPRSRITFIFVRPRLAITRSVRLTCPLSMALRAVTSENRSGEKRATSASSRHSGRLSSNSSRYALVRLVRSAFDSRFMRNVRKSSTFRLEPLRGSLSQGHDDFDIGRARGFCCILVTGNPTAHGAHIRRERRFCRNASRLDRTITKKKRQEETVRSRKT